MSATLTDIARATNTSVSTVSRVLAGGAVSKRISKETRERVTAAAQKMGYRPNLIARSLRTRRSHTVAFLCGDIANPFYSAIASSIEVKLHAAGYSLMLCNTAGSAEREAEYLRLLPQRAVDGLIITPRTRTRKGLFQDLPESLPVVVLERPSPGVASVVSTDQDQLAGALYDTLASAGVKDVCVIAGPADIVTYRRRAELAGERFRVLATHEGRAQRETGQAAVARFEGLKPDAVIACNGFLGQGFIEKYGLTTDGPVMGVFDEVPMMDLLPIPIACSVQDVQALAQGCVDQILALLGNAEAKLSPVLTPSRVVTNPAFEARAKRG